MGFQPAASLTEKIAEHIGMEIIAGRLQPRTRIQELKVAAQLGVSRGSVREALLILERRHLVQIQPRRGATVSTLEAEELADCAELMTELQTSFYRKLALVRNLDTAGFQTAIGELAHAVQGGHLDDALAARGRFAGAGFAQLKNYYLTSVLEGLIPAGLRLTHLAASHPDYDLRDGLRYHQALLRAMTARDPDQVQQLVHAFNGRERKLALGSLDTQRLAS